MHRAEACCYTSRNQVGGLYYVRANYLSKQARSSNTVTPLGDDNSQVGGQAGSDAGMEGVTSGDEELSSREKGKSPLAGVGSSAFEELDSGWCPAM